MTATFKQSTGQPDPAHTPSLFALRGRIGRVRYLAYSVLPNLLMLGASAGMGIAGSAGGTLALEGLAALAALALAILIGGRRLHDMGRTRWFAAGLLIPVVNLAVFLWLLCTPGDAGANRFGPAPGPNTRAVIALAWAMPIVYVASVLVAMALAPHKSAAQRAHDEMEQAI